MEGLELICGNCGVSDCPHLRSFRPMFEGTEDEPAQTQMDESSESCNIHSGVLGFEELLIANVEARPALWNSKLKLGQRGKAEKDQLWLEIAKFFDNRHSVDVLQKKWRNLRDHFVKVKGELETYAPSGSGAKPKKKVWKHYEALKFLSDTMTPRATTSNLLAEPGTSKESSVDRSVSSTPEPQTPKGVKRARDNSSLILDAIKSLPAPPPMIPTLPPVNPICQRLSEMLQDLDPESRLDLEIKLLQLAQEFVYEKKINK